MFQKQQVRGMVSLKVTASMSSSSGWPKKGDIRVGVRNGKVSRCDRFVLGGRGVGILHRLHSRN